MYAIRSYYDQPAAIGSLGGLGRVELEAQIQFLELAMRELAAGIIQLAQHITGLEQVLEALPLGRQALGAGDQHVDVAQWKQIRAFPLV